MWFIAKFWTKHWLLSVSTTGLILLCGCASSTLQPLQVPQSEMDAFLRDKPKELQPLYSQVLPGGERNAVLSYLQIGVAALQMEEFALAEDAFDQAIMRISKVYADDENARNARSLWHEEGAKTFIGEPYERAMAYYYRGLLYMRAGDLENARACFKSGAIQDAFAEEEQHRCDFALFYLLQGWASQLLGDNDLADEAYRMVEALRPDFKRPIATHNLLVLVETGTAPRKLADGVGHGELKYFRGKNFKENRVTISINGEVHHAYPLEDIYWQARSRGGREIDRILEGKVYFKNSGQESSSALAATGSMIQSLANSLNSPVTLGVGAGISLVSGVVNLVASGANTYADTRYWSNLPDMVHFITAELPANSKTTSVQTVYADVSGNTVADADTVHVASHFQGGSLYWNRSRSALLTKQ